MFVYKLSEYEKDLLKNQEFQKNSKFSPILDIDNNWVISKEEVNYCENIGLSWVKKLELIEYKPIKDDINNLQKLF
jgi:hypothetical protein